MKQLKTLLERATLELREKIETYEDNYPVSGEHLKSVLSKYYFISDLPYGTVIEIEGLYRESRINVFEKFEHI